MSRQAHRSLPSRWLLGLALPAAAVLSGCDNDSGRADKKVADDLAAAMAANPNTVAGHKFLDDAVKVSGASLSLQLRAKAMLADAELRLAQDAVATATRNSAQIDRLTNDIGQATEAIAADNALATALGKYQPAEVLGKLSAQSSTLTGSDESPNWTPAPDVTLASMSAADKAAATLQQQVDQLAGTVKTDGDARTDLLGKADKLDQQSEQEQGEKSLDLFTQGADARKQAADLAVKIAGENGQLDRAKADLAVQQAEHGAVTAAQTQGVDKETSAVNDGWASTQAQLKMVKSHAASLLGDPAAPTDAGGTTVQGATVLAKVAQLTKLRDQNRGLIGDAESHYNNAIGFYKDAHDRAKQLLTELSDLAHSDRPDRADHVAWDADKASIDPSYYQYLQATAQMDRAGFYARLTGEAKRFADLTTAVKPVLVAAQLELPSGLADTNGDAALAVKKDHDLATKGFKDALDLLGNVTGGAAPSAVVLRQGATVATMFADYGLSLLATGAGDAQEAGVQMQGARTALKNAMDMPGSMPALPADLAGDVPTGAEPAAAPGGAVSIASLVGVYKGAKNVTGPQSPFDTTSVTITADGHFTFDSLLTVTSDNPTVMSKDVYVGTATLDGGRLTLSGDTVNGAAATPQNRIAGVYLVQDGGRRLVPERDAEVVPTLTRQP